LLNVNGRLSIGRNSGAVDGGTNVTLRPLNAQTRTHAEGEAFQRYFDKASSYPFINTKIFNLTRKYNTISEPVL
jgi:hypothetical protein